MSDEKPDEIDAPRVMDRLRNVLIVFNILILLIVIRELAPWLH